MLLEHVLRFVGYQIFKFESDLRPLIVTVHS